MSKDENLQAFKIGDTRSPTIGQPKAQKRTRQQEQQSEEASVGFDRIERILEDEDPVRLSETLSALHDKLEAHQESAQSNRDKAQAKKALGAVERTADLMNFLFQTKASMEAGDE
ncbi:MAG: hypothetical protein AAFQ82_06420 [Myxococcota bacterium]